MSRRRCGAPLRSAPRDRGRVSTADSSCTKGAPSRGRGCPPGPQPARGSREYDTTSNKVTREDGSDPGDGFPITVDRNAYPRPEYRFPNVKIGTTYQDSVADFPSRRQRRRARRTSCWWRRPIPPWAGRSAHHAARIVATFSETGRRSGSARPQRRRAPG
jgi:hypothetical protein